MEERKMVEEEKITHFGTVNFEKRKHPRFSLDLPVEYCRMNSSKSHPAHTGNISEGGILLYLPEEIETGELLRLRLFIDSGLDFMSINALVQVAWRGLHSAEKGDYRTGVRFVDISDQDFCNLQNFLKSLMELKTDMKLNLPPRLLSALGINPVGDDAHLLRDLPDQN